MHLVGMQTPTVAVVDDLHLVWEPGVGMVPYRQGQQRQPFPARSGCQPHEKRADRYTAV